MRYRLLDVDVTRPLPELPSDEDCAGLGVLLRDGWRPLGFLLVGRSEVPLTGSAFAQLAAQLSVGSSERSKTALRQLEHLTSTMMVPLGIGQYSS